MRTAKVQIGISPLTKVREGNHDDNRKPSR